MYPRQQKEDGKHNKFVDAMMRNIMSGQHNWTLDPGVLETFMYSLDQMLNKTDMLKDVSEKSIFWARLLAESIQQHNEQYQKEDDLCQVTEIRAESRGQTKGEIVFTCRNPSGYVIDVTCLSVAVDNREEGAYTLDLEPSHYAEVMDLRWSDVSPEGPYAEMLPLYAVKKYIFE